MKKIIFSLYFILFSFPAISFADYVELNANELEKIWSYADLEAKPEGFLGRWRKFLVGFGGFENSVITGKYSVDAYLYHPDGRAHEIQIEEQRSPLLPSGEDKSYIFSEFNLLPGYVEDLEFMMIFEGHQAKYSRQLKVSLSQVGEMQVGEAFISEFARLVNLVAEDSVVVEPPKGPRRRPGKLKRWFRKKEAGFVYTDRSSGDALCVLLQTDSDTMLCKLRNSNTYNGYTQTIYYGFRRIE